MLTSVARRSVQKFRYSRSVKRAESQSSHRDDPTARRIISAIHRANQGKFTADEQKAFAAIEARRYALLADQSPMNTLDFGAGEVQSLLTKEQQEAGFEFHYTVSQIASASKPEAWARLLYEIVNEFRPSHVIEMGSCVGISGSYMAQGLKLSGGHLTTIEGSPTVSKLAGDTFKTLGYDNVTLVNGRFSDVLIQRISERTAEIVFVDGHHDGDATIAYFDQMLPFLKAGSIVIFDDISWSDSMKSGWQSVSRHARVSAYVDMASVGIVVLN
jgi:predicted O-methyltransferase YrrM